MIPKHVFPVFIGAGVLALSAGPHRSVAAAAAHPTPAPSATAAPLPAAAATAIPAYASDALQSRLDFSGTQAGAAFQGTFKKFSVIAQFDAAQLASSRIEVQIDMTSLDSNDADRDKTMRGAEFFDVAKIPGAHFITRSISKTANSFTAMGALTLRGVTKDVPITFNFTSNAGGAALNGDATVQRLAFGVGQGDWKSTEWVSDAVKVHFAIALKRKP